MMVQEGKTGCNLPKSCEKKYMDIYKFLRVDNVKQHYGSLELQETKLVICF